MQAFHPICVVFAPDADRGPQPMAARRPRRRGAWRWRSSSAAGRAPTPPRPRSEAVAGRAGGRSHLPPQRRPPGQPRRRGQGRGGELPAWRRAISAANPSSARGTCASASSASPTASTRRSWGGRDQEPGRQGAGWSANPSTSAKYAGPNGVLAEEIGSAGGYSPCHPARDLLPRPESRASTAWWSTSPRTAA